MTKISMRSSIFLITVVEKMEKMGRNISSNKWNNSSKNQMIFIKIYHHWYLLRIIRLELYQLVLLLHLLQPLIILGIILIKIRLLLISHSTLTATTIWIKTVLLVVWTAAQLQTTSFTCKAVLNSVRNQIILRKR